MAKSTFSSRHKLTILTLVVAFIFLLALNAFSTAVFRDISVDLTQDKEFTLSPGTKKVLASLKEPITLRFFLSPDMIEKVPSYAPQISRVRDLLELYARLSKGKIRLEYYKPLPFSEDEDRAEAYGIQGVPLNTSGRKIYFGLAGTNSVDEEEKVAFFNPNRAAFIEYDLTRLVHKLGRTKKVVGLISPLPLRGTFSMRGGSRPPWPIMTEIQREFEVKAVGSDIAKIPADIDMLMIVHPRLLSDKMQFAIDQYVLAGGKALVMVDPVPLTAPRRRTFAGAGPVPPGSDLPKLFKSWGVVYKGGKVATDTARSLRVPSKYQGRTVTAPHIGYIQIRASEMSQKDPVTAKLRLLIFGIAGHFDKAKGAKTTFTPLVWTTPGAMSVDAIKFRANEPNLVGLYQAYKPGKKTLPLVVRITGKPASAFPNGLKKKDAKKGAKKPDTKKADAKKGANDKTKKSPEPLKRAAKSIDVILISDVDLMDVNFWAQTSNQGGQRILVPFANNADLIKNALESLTGSLGLTGLRSRGSARREFTKISDLEKESAARLRTKQAELARKLKGLRAKITSARSKSKDGKTVLSEKQQAELNANLASFLTIRREQRAVLFALRKDVDGLQQNIRILNIGMIPVLIGIIALIVIFFRIRRRRRRHETA